MLSDSTWKILLQIHENINALNNETMENITKTYLRYIEDMFLCDQLSLDLEK